MANGITNLYDYETPIEDGFSCALQDAGLTVVTLRSGVAFQETRPRVELLFKLGPARQSYGPVGFTELNASWTGRLEIELITNTADTRQARAFRIYRASLRNIMASLRPPTDNQFGGINSNRTAGLPDLTIGDRVYSSGDQYLLYHKVQNIIEDGADPDPQPDKGLETSKLYYRIDFGIDAAAWAELATNP